MKNAAGQGGAYGSALDHFLKITKSYWRGLFACYDVEGLPRTNNDLEHLFGSSRYLERRTGGHKAGAPTAIVRGAARIVAATGTRPGDIQVEHLVPTSIPKWKAFRAELDRRQRTRALGRRFRSNPAAYLRSLEDRFKRLLPP